MKSTLIIALLLLGSLAFAQSEAKPAAPSDADKSFDLSLIHISEPTRP